jgi:hypothetical protein
MRLFLYKSLFILVAVFILYKITIGSLINRYENKIENYFTKETIEKYKVKIREELQDASTKDRILKKEDAELLSQILKKLQREILESEK